MQFQVEREERWKLIINNDIEITWDGPTYRWFASLEEKDRAMVIRIIYEARMNK
jgi:hypothetical protein